MQLQTIPRAPVSGVLNPSEFLLEGQRELERVSEHRGTITVVYVSVPGPRRPNHVRDIAEILKRNTRNTDVIGEVRAGRFIVLLADLSAEDAFAFIHRIADRLHDTSIVIGGLTYLECPASIETVIHAAERMKNSITKRVQNNGHHVVIP